MCLIAEHLEARVATEDIKCYKILQKDMKSYYHGYDTSGYASHQLIVNRVIPREELFSDFDFEKYPYKVGQKIKVSDNDDESGTCMTIEEIVPEDKIVYIKTDYTIYISALILMTDKEGRPLFSYSPSITIIE